MLRTRTPPRLAPLAVAALAVVVALGAGPIGSVPASAVARPKPTPRHVFPVTAIPTQNGTWPSSPSPVVDVNGTGFFVADAAPPHYVEDCRGCGTYETRNSLFRTDGTTAGTQLVATLPGPVEVSSIHAAGGRLWFNVDKANTNTSIGLWTSDGTAAGTVPVTLVAGHPGVTGTIVAANPDRIFVMTAGEVTAGARPETLLAIGPGDAAGTAIWAGSITDSTSNGQPTFTGYAPPVTAADGTVYFAVPGTPPSAVELWRTDGTPAGTRDTGIAGTPIGASGTTLWVKVDGRMVRSDGTPQGTLPAPSGYPLNATIDRYGQVAAITTSRLFFIDAVSGTGSSTIQRVWSTDGTHVAPVSATAAYDGDGGPQLVALPSRAVYVLKDAKGVPQVWSSDGSGAAPVQLTQLPRAIDADRISNLTAVGSLAYFQLGDDVRVTDGTVDGTRTIATVPLVNDEEAAGQFAAAGGHTFYAGYEPDAGLEPWVTDGTAAGTHLLADVDPVPYGYSTFEALPAPSFGTHVLFTRRGYSSTALWTSDGTPAGTRRIKQLPQDVVAPLRRSGPDLYLKLQTWVASDGRIQLWRSDGTTAGTIAASPDLQKLDSLAALPRGGVVFNGLDANGGKRGIWASDGTAGSAHLIAAAPRTAAARRSTSDSNHEHFTAAGPYLYFQYAGPRGDWLLRRTDGTAAGTRAVPGVRGRVSARAAVRGRLWFARSTRGAGRQLWSTDGTTHGLRQETRARGGLDDVTAISEAPGGRTIFATVGHGSVRLWSTARGRTAPTAIGALPNRPFDIGLVGKRLVFDVQTGESHTAIWATDGTRGGTQLVKTIDDSDIEPAVTEGGERYFQFEGDDYDGILPTLWRTDGTARGTQRLAPQVGPAPQAFTGVLMATSTKVLLSVGGTLASAAP